MGSSTSRVDEPYNPYAVGDAGYGSFSSSYSSGSGASRKARTTVVPYYPSVGYQSAYPTIMYPAAYAANMIYPQAAPAVQLTQQQPATVQFPQPDGAVQFPQPGAGPTFPVPQAGPNGDGVPPMQSGPSISTESGEPVIPGMPSPQLHPQISSGSHPSSHDSGLLRRGSYQFRRNPLPEPPREVEIPAHLISDTAVTFSSIPARRPGLYGHGHAAPTHRLRHPLPPPPQDMYDKRRYRDLREGAALRAGVPLPMYPTGWQTDSHHVHRHKRGSSLLGRTFSKFIRRLTRGSGSSHHAQSTPYAPVVPPFAIPPYYAPPAGVSLSASPTQPAPVRFDRMTDNTGLTHVSPHKILYKKKLYPTALHLYEAFKYFGSRNDLAERVRTTERLADVLALAVELRPHAKPDWNIIMREKMEEALYMKFRQHADLRALLMETGTAELIYAEQDDAFWGEGEDGQGNNELGKALFNVRERLRREGAGR